MLPIEPKSTNYLRPDLDVLAATPMAAHRSWVLWRYVYDDEHQRWTKRLCMHDFYRNRAYWVSSTKPQHWQSFRVVREAYRLGGYDGVGYVFSAADPFVGVDLDHVIDAAGRLIPWASRIIARFANPILVERSVSGTGVHIYLKGALPEGRGRVTSGPTPGSQVEVYSARRFFCCTGRSI
jgi:putative DNA primase/helicase